MTTIKTQVFNIGDLVLCDLCNRDFTDDPISGGLQFQSQAVCPECAPRIRASAINYGEQEYIIAECPEYLSFADWVRSVLRRGNDGTVKVISF